MKTSLHVAAALAAIVWTSTAMGAPFLSTNDFVIAIDRDPALSLSSYPANEPPFNVLDGSSATKYLNFGEINTGFMVTPFGGASTIKSMSLTTANDAVDRDPASYAVFGTNDTIDLTAAGVDNGTSMIANWTLISQGNLSLPATRLTAGTIVPFAANATAYKSYRVLFPTVKNAAAANSMQIADVGLYTGSDGVTGNVLSALDSIAAFQLPVPDSRFNAGQAPRFVLDPPGPNLTLPAQSGYPANENPPLLIDGNINTKYLNTGANDTGFIVTPASGASIVKSFQLSTANDAVERDPLTYQLFGTNAPIVSADNSYGLAETWTLIQAGDVALPPERLTAGPIVPITNTTSYTSYKMLFPTVKDVPGTNLMQLSEASFFTDTAGTSLDILNTGDPIKAVDGTVVTGLDTKYLNFGRENSGIIITPAAGSKVITSLQITTADDTVGRDPSSFELYGTNDTITSVENSVGNSENWTLITTGALTLPDERKTVGPLVPITNTTAYKSYRLVFPTVKDNTAAGVNSMQIAALQFFDSSVVVDVDLDNNNIVDGRDLMLIQQTDPSLIPAWKTQFGQAAASGSAAGVPEPASVGLALLAAAGVLASQRRASKRRGG